MENFWLEDIRKDIIPSLSASLDHPHRRGTDKFEKSTIQGCTTQISWRAKCFFVAVFEGQKM